MISLIMYGYGYFTISYISGEQPMFFVQDHSSQHVYTTQEQNTQNTIRKVCRGGGLGSGGSFVMRHCREWFNDS